MNVAAMRALHACALVIAVCNGACGSEPPPRVVSADGVRAVQWTAEQLDLDIAIQTVRTTPHASFHWVRARGAEKPHIHERTDMTVFVVSGKVVMHIGELHVDAAPGDVIDVPMGTPHWVENVHSEASTAFVIFSPAFNPADRRFIR